MSLFPLDQPLTPAEAAGRPDTQQQVFSSFDQARYAASLARQRREQADGGLAAAASRFESSSSDDESQEQPGKPGEKARSASNSDCSGQAVPSRKRRRAYHKQGRHKHKKKSRRTDAEKILEKEHKAAALGIKSTNRQGYAILTSAALPDVNQAQEDRRGDLQNSALQSLHQAPVTKAWDPRGLQGALSTYGVAKLPTGRGLGIELDDDKQRSKGGRNKARDDKPEGIRIRFFTKFRLGLEQDRSLRRWRLKMQETRRAQAGGDIATLALPAPAFVPLASDSQDAAAGRAESAGEALQRQQRLLQAAVKQRHHDLQAWLDLVALLERSTAVHAPGAAEHMAAVLEGALRWHPRSETLLIKWLPLWCQTEIKAQNKHDYLGLWRMKCQSVPGCTELWRLFLDWLLHDYPHLSPDATPDTSILQLAQQEYGGALQAQAGEVAMRVQQGAGPAEVEQLEEGMVALLGDACRLHLCSGHTEKAVGIIQALLEFHFFSPALAGPFAVKKRLFEAFWNQTNALIGEEGALGWSTWLSHGPPQPSEDSSEPEARPAKQPAEEEDRGGWTETILDRDLPVLAGPADHGEEEDNQDDADVIALLGEEGQDTEETPAGPEASSEQHAQQPTIYGSHGWTEEAAWTWAELDQAEDDEATAPAARTPREDTFAGSDEVAGTDSRLAWAEVRQLLTPLSSACIRQQLVHTLLDVLDAPLGQWTSSNSPAAVRATNTRPSLRADTAAALAACVQGDKAEQPHAVPWLCLGSSMPFDPGTGDVRSQLDEAAYQAWFEVSEARRSFLARMLRQLVDGPLSDDSLICTAFIAVEGQAALPVLANEEQAEDGLQALAAAACQEGVARARAAAKSVLARRRESLVLWSAYAQFEARVGNRKAARKVWSTVLTSLADRPASVGRHAAELVLPFAEMEAAGKGADAAVRALHVLTWLGVGGQYAAYQGRPDVTASAFRDRLLQAKQGYSAMLTAHMSGGALSPAGAAVIAAAAVFELMAGAIGQPEAGADAAANILEQVLDAAPAEGVEYEGLHVRLCRLVLHSAADRLPKFTPGRLHLVLKGAVKKYPGNAELWSMFAKAEAEAHMSSRLRRSLASRCTEHPQCLVALLAHACMLSTLPASNVLVGNVLSMATRPDAGPLRHCPVLHRAFAWYGACHEAQASAPVRFNRGLAECPWSKVLLLERFGSANAQLSNYESLLEKAQQWGLLLRTSASWAMQVSEHTSRQPNRIATMAATLARVQHATGQLEH